MLAFPQLSSGAIAQFPNVRGQQYRTRIVETAGGVVYRMGDERARATVWTLPMTGLTPEERVSVDALFAATEGRLRTFTFLDPNDNLLAHSSNYSQSVWVKQAGLVLVGGQSDPFGGTTGVRATNPTGQALQMYQEIATPGNYQYCLSAHVKQETGSSPRLMMGPASDLRFETVSSANVWTRFSVSGKSTSTEAAVRAGVELAPLSEIVLCGVQMEAAAVASRYKETGTRSGVYSRCRFVEDELRWTAEGPGEHSVRLTVMTVN
ncbi:MAG: hypothetical protein HY820_11005 [Acidobacteria bacterium]|nr:hypothetical protein [Acidobacteriota bacterium]